MRKNKLIEMLNAISGNPEICIASTTNGKSVAPGIYSLDGLESVILGKESKEYWLEMIGVQAMRYNDPVNSESLSDENYRRDTYWFDASALSKDRLKRVCGKHVKNIFVVTTTRTR